MELKLKCTKEVEDRKLEIYDLGRYTVKVVRYADGWSYTTIERERAEYLPEIYSRTDMEGKVLGFEIQTTSYGSLPVEEIKKMIAGLNEAIEVVETLNKEFAKA